jgi:hypothetical protein
MAEASQFTFTHKELVDMLIKQAGVHEGKWMLMVNFGFGAVNGGPSPDQIFPTAFAAIQFIGIQRATEDSPPSLVADAAVVNPKPKGKSDERAEGRRKA